MIFLVLHRTNDGYIRLCTRLLVVALLILISVPVFAAQVTFKPSLELSETYTDNVDPLNNPGEEDYITGVTPNFALQTNGSRLNTNLGVTSENFFYMKDSSRNAWYYDLMADASAELVKDFAFLNLGANGYRRAISSSGGLAQSNHNVADPANTFTWLINPHFKKRFAGKAEGAASYSHKEIRNDGQGLSDAEIEAVQVGLKSGPSFRRMTWSLDYSQETTKRNEASNYREESSIAQMDYRVYKKLGILFHIGSEYSDLLTAQNGSYYAVGIKIVPRSTLQIDLLSGNRRDMASISWVSTRGSALDILWRNEEVGQNPGKSLQGTLLLINRRMAWRASYRVERTSEQNLQGSELDTENSSLQLDSSHSSECAPSNQVFKRKYAQTGFEYKTARSLISISLDRERREFDDSDDEKSRKGTFSWSWRFATRTTMLLEFLDSKSECSGAGAGAGDKDSHDMSIGFFRKMGRGMEGSVKAQFKSGDGPRSYDENSLKAGVKWHF